MGAAELRDALDRLALAARGGMAPRPDVLPALRAEWSRLESEDQPRWIAAIAEAYRAPRVPIREALRRDKAMISFFLDRIEDPRASNLVVAIAGSWLAERLDADLGRLASELDVAFLVKPLPLLERIASAANDARRHELAHGAFLALRERVPERFLEFTMAAARALTAAGSAEKAAAFLRTSLRHLRRAGREAEATKLEAELAVEESEAANNPQKVERNAGAEPAVQARRSPPEATGETRPPDTMDVKEAARILDVSIPTVYAWAKKGVIPAIRIGRVVRFDRQTFMIWRREHMAGGGLPKTSPAPARRPRRRR